MFDTRYGVLLLEVASVSEDLSDVAKVIEDISQTKIERKNVSIVKFVEGRGSTDLFLLGVGLANDNFVRLVAQVPGVSMLGFYELSEGAYYEILNDPSLDDPNFLKELMLDSVDCAILYGPSSVDEQSRLSALRKMHSNLHVRICLADFIRDGKFGPISIGTSKDAVLRVLGVPDRWTVEPERTRLESSRCWGYGALSVNFGSNMVDEIWLSFFYGDDCSDHIKFDGFVPSSEVTLSEFEKYLDSQKIKFHIEDEVEVISKKVGNKERVIKRKRPGSVVVIEGSPLLDIKFSGNGSLLGMSYHSS
jgi:hypothetical protein